MQVYVARNRSRPAVLSMSVEGFQSTILDDMVERLYQDNVTVVVAAGNTEVPFSHLYICLALDAYAHRGSRSISIV